MPGQKPQHDLRRTHAPPQLFPQLLGGVKLGWEYLAKGVLEDVDSGQKAVPGSLQAAGLDRLRRGIKPRADLRLGIEGALEPIHFQGPIRQSIGGQHRNGVTTRQAQKAFHRKLLPSLGLLVSLIGAVTVHPSRAASRASRSIPFETVSANLDTLSRTDYTRQIKPESLREHETMTSLQFTNVNPQLPRNSVDGYTLPP